MAYQPCHLQGGYESYSWGGLRAYMLSALIPTEHSYPAVLLAEQPVHQRFVPPGPLVTYSTIARCVDYIFTPPIFGCPTLKKTGVGVL